MYSSGENKILDWFTAAGGTGEKGAHAMHSEGPRVLVLGAHPDDEIVGASSRLARTFRVVSVTDGAPENMRDALAAGFSTRELYASVRKKESIQALSLAGLPQRHWCCLGFSDQGASFSMHRLTATIAGLFLVAWPDAVVTHAYEGGHPDHDATAFGVHCACRLFERRRLRPPELIEMTSYHRGPEGGMETGCFLGGDSDGVKVIQLDEEERKLKRKMMDCHVSQQKALSKFEVNEERFRLAPEYDFLKPPHPGKLYYEQFDWGMSGESWRGFARHALKELGIAGIS